MRRTLMNLDAKRFGMRVDGEEVTVRGKMDKEDEIRLYEVVSHDGKTYSFLKKANCRDAPKKEQAAEGADRDPTKRSLGHYERVDHRGLSPGK